MKIRVRRYYILSVCIAGLLLSCSYDFYKNQYNATGLEEKILDKYPESYFIEDLIWISSSKTYCNSTCLQMIGEWKGIHEPVDYYNWLMGHTYGAFYKDSFVRFMPLADPMKGIMFASSFMGLERILYSTNDRELCIRGIKTYLSKGYPVIIPLNYNALAGGDFFFPHAELLVGYDDKDNFFYYEPSFSERFTTGERGLTASVSSIMDGMKGLGETYGVTLYNFMIFEDADYNKDFNKVWLRNGEVLMGNRIGIVNLSSGSESFLSLAGEIKEKAIPEWGFRELLTLWFDVGRYTREDNAIYIQENFSDNQTLMEVADLFMESSAHFTEMLLIIKNNKTIGDAQIERISDLLILTAEKERTIASKLMNF